MMKFAAIKGGLALSLCLTACNNEPEETPDITEAIPVDKPDDGSAAGSGNAGEIDRAPAANADSGSNPAGGTGANTQPQPRTMESGSNASDTPIRLEGSKLQRADPTD